jgi:hypothetical protein
MTLLSQGMPYPSWHLLGIAASQPFRHSSSCDYPGGNPCSIQQACCERSMIATGTRGPHFFLFRDSV